MPTFREPCSPLHQSEEQPDTELFLLYYAACWSDREGEGKKRIVEEGVMKLVGLQQQGEWSSIFYSCCSYYLILDCLRKMRIMFHLILFTLLFDEQ